VNESLKERIVLSRITDLSELTERERATAESDDEITELMGENLALEKLASQASLAPDRAEMVSRAKARLNFETSEVTFMGFLRSFFFGKRWYFKFAGIAAIVALFLAVGVMLPAKSSFAATNGYLLVFDLGAIPASDNTEQATENANAICKKIQDALKAWEDAHKAEVEAYKAEGKCKLLISVNINNGEGQAMVGLLGGDDKALESLKVALAEVPGLPEPTISDATWFAKAGDSPELGGLVIDVHGHIFTFPESATEEEIESTINAWLAENKPGATADVEVVIEEANGERRVEIRIEMHGEDEDQPGAEE